MITTNILPREARAIVGHSVDIASFEEEVSTGGRVAHVGSIDAFSRVYTAAPRRVYHETIHGDRPCRLIVDIDGHHSGMPTDTEIYAVAEEVHNLVVLHTIRLGMLTPPSPPEYIWTACRPGTFSVHLIWNVGCQTPTHCRGFLEGIIPDFTKSYKIDTQIFKGMRSAGTLRMPYSTKIRTDAPLLPLGHPPELSLDIWSRSLVTFHDGMSTTLPLVKLTGFIPVKLSIRRMGAPSAGPNRYEREVLEWMIMTLPYIDVVVDRMSTIQIRAYCRNRTDIHLSNTMYLSVSPDFSLMLYCLSQSCRCNVRMLYTPTQAYLSTRPMDIDWGMI